MYMLFMFANDLALAGTSSVDMASRYVHDNDRAELIVSGERALHQVRSWSAHMHKGTGCTLSMH